MKRNIILFCFINITFFSTMLIASIPNIEIKEGLNINISKLQTFNKNLQNKNVLNPNIYIYQYTSNIEIYYSSGESVTKKSGLSNIKGIFKFKIKNKLQIHNIEAYGKSEEDLYTNFFKKIVQIIKEIDS